VVKPLTVFAMTEKGYAVVRWLLSRYPGLVDCVVGARDRTIAEDYHDEIADLCRHHSVRFRNRSEAYSIRTEYALAVSWRWLIQAGTSRLVVFHDSLLPSYRGFNPLVTALLNGDEEIGVTALHASAEYDRGDIIAQSASAVTYPIKIRDAIKLVVGNYEALADNLGRALSGGQELPATPQDEAQASYSLWRDEEDYFIDWTSSAAEIRRFVDAVGFPYKGAAAGLEGKVVRILDAEALDDVPIANRTAGKVIFVRDSKPVVVCGHGLLKINELTEDVTGASLLPLQRFRLRFKGTREMSPAQPTPVAQPRQAA
jgi:methionyl-tRNA formyltransferase